MIVHYCTVPELEKIYTKQEDILILRGTIKNMKVTIILVYLSVSRGATEKKSNQDIMTLIRKGISHCDDDEVVFIMGDFNAHVGIIVEQELNYNDTDKCKGTYTYTLS